MRQGRRRRARRGRKKKKRRISASLLLTRRDLHALGDKVLRVAGRLAVPLAERLEVVELVGREEGGARR